MIEKSLERWSARIRRRGRTKYPASPYTVDTVHSRETLERILVDNVIPFWYPRVLDRNDGGFHMNHDEEGRWKGPCGKRLIAQARMLLYFSQLARSQYAKPEYLAAATHGFEFLSGRMWDKEYGGFFWEMDPSGKTPTMPHKHLYAQAFALYALSEYAAAGGDQRAAPLARELYRLMDENARDRKHGGYREFFFRDWTSPPAGTSGYLGVPSDVKLMNTHMHLLEAMTKNYIVTSEQAARQRIVELIAVQSNAVVRKALGVCTDTHAADWAPRQDAGHEEISYGHNVENVTILIDACDAAGISNGPYLDLYKHIYDFVLRYGFDNTKGGIFEAGRGTRPAHKRSKVWWVQAEGMLGLLKMFRQTGEEKYLRCFQRELDWIAGYQADWKHGEWHDRFEEDGTATGDKAGPWKDPYHTARAILGCLDILKGIGTEGNPMDAKA